MEYETTDRNRTFQRPDQDAASDLRPPSHASDEQSLTSWHGVTRDWSDRKGALAREWSHLTKEDIEGIDASRLSLLERLEARYGWTAEESTFQVETWLERARRLRFL
jgi:hypothetical protein